MNLNNLNIEELSKHGLDPEFVTEQQMKLKPNQQAIIYDVEGGDVNLPDVQQVLSQVIEVLEYMTTEEVLDLRSEDNDKYVEHMEEKFKTFSDRYYGLFRKLISGEDITPLMQMLAEIEKVKDGEKTIEEAEKTIGESLAEKYVYPNIGKP